MARHDALLFRNSKFAASLYSKHSELLVPGAAAGSPHIQSQTGVRQGDPAGGLYFGLTLQGVLELMQELFPELRLIAYADDVYLQGSTERCLRHTMSLSSYPSTSAYRYNQPNVQPTARTQMQLARSLSS